MYGLDCYDVMHLAGLIEQYGQGEADKSLAKKLWEIAETMDPCYDVLPLEKKSYSVSSPDEF